MKTCFISLLALLLPVLSADAAERTFQLKDYGVVPGADSLSLRIDRALKTIRLSLGKGERAKVVLEKGTYRFVPEESVMHDFYISNHDQVVHHPTALCIEAWDGLTVDAKGSTFLCTGRMLPVAISHSRHIRVLNLCVDFETPHISQVTVTANSQEEGIRFKPSNEVKWRINAEGRFEAYGPGWDLTYNTGIAFDGEHRYIVPQTSDLWIDMNACRTTADGEVWAPNWKNERLKPGTRVALRSYHRPAPAFAVNETEGLDIRNVPYTMPRVWASWLNVRPTSASMPSTSCRTSRRDATSPLRPMPHTSCSAAATSPWSTAPSTA